MRCQNPIAQGPLTYFDSFLVNLNLTPSKSSMKLFSSYFLKKIKMSMSISPCGNRIRTQIVILFLWSILWTRVSFPPNLFQNERKPLYTRLRGISFGNTIVSVYCVICYSHGNFSLKATAKFSVLIAFYLISLLGISHFIRGGLHSSEGKQKPGKLLRRSSS